jgi:hypothetical protein
MKVTVDGQVYEFDQGTLLVSEAMDIQSKTVGTPGHPNGLRLVAWQRGLNELDAFAVRALVYLLKKRAGENPDWDTIEFNLAALEFDDEDEDEPEIEAPKEDGPDQSGSETS